MERFRGSSDIPLSAEGLGKAHELGQKLAARGGVDRIIASDLNRTQTTAQIIHHYTRAPIVHVGPELQPWHLGGLEGQEITPEKVDYMNSMILDHPDHVPEGVGPESTSVGESFNQFKSRVLPMFDKALREHVANPSERTALVTHFRNRKLMEAWIRKGAPADGDVDKAEMTQEGGPPGSMLKVSHDPRVGYVLNDVDEDGTQSLGGGVYLIRHEKTDWNKTSPSSEPPTS